MSSGSSKPQITTQTSDPWKPAQSYLLQGLSGASSLLKNKTGFNPYTGNALAPLNQMTKDALSQTKWLSGQPVPGLAAGQGFATDMIANRGMTPELNGVADRYRAFADSDTGLTGAQESVGGRYQAFADSKNGLTAGQEESLGLLNPFARGEYTEDPRLTQRLSADRQDAMNASATAFGGGRY